jgi:renalase
MEMPAMSGFFIAAVTELNRGDFFMHLAVIGAGIAGLSCARELLAHGHSVVVYERSTVVGGRMSTRETELGGFDHGAQYFTAGSAAFRKAIAAWRNAGWVLPWEGRFAVVEHGVAKAAGRNGKAGGPRMVAVPGMAALAQRLAAGIDVRTDQSACSLESFGAQWLVKVKCESVPVEASAGPFDAVLVAMPADQALALLAPLDNIAQRIDGVHLVPCWALMLGFQESLGLDYDGAWVNRSRLSWIARDASKPQRRPGEHWVAHASPDWSLEHLEDDPERVKEKLLKAFHEATGSAVQPVYADVHRWRFAQAVMPLAADCLWDPRLRVGACGDWFSAGLEGGGRVENAYLSGLALAAAIDRS